MSNHDLEAFKRQVGLNMARIGGLEDTIREMQGASKAGDDVWAVIRQICRHPRIVVVKTRYYPEFRCLVCDWRWPQIWRPWPTGKRFDQAAAAAGLTPRDGPPDQREMP